MAARKIERKRMTTYEHIQTEISDYIRSWERHRRAQQTIGGIARALWPGLALGVLLGIASRIWPLFDNAQILFISAGGVLVGLLALWLWVYLRRRPLVSAARYFDLRFGLKERLSTALELLEGRIPAGRDLRERQIADAHEHARRVNAADYLRVTPRRDEWALVAALVIVLAALVIIPNPLSAGPSGDPQSAAFITESIEDVESAIETIATDPALDDESRRELLETLELTLATLEDEAISLDEALALMGEAEDLLRQSASDIREQLEAQADALTAASEALDANDDMTPFEGLQAALDEIAEQLGAGALDEEALERTAEALEQTARQLDNVAPSVAEAMQEAAEAMENALSEEEREAARDALERARDALEQIAEQQDEAEQSADALDSAADALNRDDATDASDADGEPEAGDGEADESGDTGESADGDDADEGGEGDGDQMDESGVQVDSESVAEGEGESGDDMTQQGQSGEGFGTELGDAGADSDGTEAGDAPEIDDDATTPDIGGQREFEAVFAPDRPDDAALGGQVELETDDTGVLLQEGDLTDNPLGQSVVPYDQVFGRYADAANTALDSVYIPLALRGVVRDYFSSLAPRRVDDD